MKHELKPCPFCGSKAQLVQYETKTKEVWHGVRCSNYDCIGNDISPEFGLETRAVNWWNMRRKDDGFTAQKWIPVTERLPKVGEFVLFSYSKNNRNPTLHASNTMAVGRYEQKMFLVEGCSVKVTHWMPLPETPKGCE